MKKVTIEIDEEYIPEGYSVTEFRQPKEGEQFIGSEGVLGRQVPALLTGPRLILKPLPKWPEWLKARCAAKNTDGQWRAFSHGIPAFLGGRWETPEDEARRPLGVPLDPSVYDLTAFPECEAADSLWLNPNHPANRVTPPNPGGQIDAEV